MQTAASASLESDVLANRSAWLAHLGAAPPGAQAARRLLLLALVVYAAVALLVVPQGIGTSWRECDTQAIARNFLVDGFDPLRPRIDWRGTTDGAVECEFPLYQLMIATVMAAAGQAEWPGRVLSLLSMLAAAISLYRLMEARVGAFGALAGAAVFLSGGHAFVLGARVQPDALSTALALAGLTTWMRFLLTGSGGTLLLATLATALGALAKPTALQIGLVQFLWTAMLAPRRLREVRVWLAFGATLGAVVLWLWHSHSLFLQTGLTFGIVSGGDSKLPDIRHLLMPELHLQLLRTTGRYGFSVLGGLGFAWLLLRRRLDRVDLALLVTVAIGLLGSFRYSHSSGLGRHYHIFAAVAGAWCVARAFPAHPGRLGWLLLLGAVAGQATLHASNERVWRLAVLDNPQLPLAASVLANSSPTELVVVHCREPAYDTFWARPYNFEDPSLLYNARRRGWVIAAGGATVDVLTALRHDGARLFVDEAPDLTTAEAEHWLEANATRVSKQGGGVIYRLTTEPTPK